MSIAPKRKYLIEGIIPESGLHLIAGPSGAGKTTWQFQMLQEYLMGLPVLGHESHPGPVFYVAADRDDDETEETMERVGITPGLFPYMSLIDSSHDISSVLSQVPHGTKLVVIEGIASLVEDGRLSDYKIVASFIKEIRRASKIHGYSVLGSVHATKTKEGERFENPRQRILGSVAWAAFSGNVILIEPDKPKAVEDGGRTLLLLPRNGKSEEHRFVLDDQGRFVPSMRAPETASRLALLAKLPNEAEFSRAEIQALGQTMNISPATVDRWIKGMISDGYINRTVVSGRYVRAIPQFEGGVLIGRGKAVGGSNAPMLSERNSADAADHLTS